LVGQAKYFPLLLGLSPFFVFTPISLPGLPVFKSAATPN